MATDSFPVLSFVFNILVNFSPEKKKTKVIYLKHIYILAISGKLHITEKFQNGMPKEARKSSNIGEVWNLVCCHGDILDCLIL